MQATDKLTLLDIQIVYEKAYDEALAEATPNEVRIGVTSSDGEKVFTERNFYWCGFSTLEFKCVGKNRELKPFGRKVYGGGFAIDIEKVGNRGNGDHEIQVSALNKTANYLNSLGYDTFVESRLD